MTNFKIKDERKMILITNNHNVNDLLILTSQLKLDKIVSFGNIDYGMQEVKDSFEETLAGFIEIDSIEIEENDVLGVAKFVANLIDELSDDKIIVDITAGTTAESIGILLGAFARNKLVYKIIELETNKAMPQIIEYPILGLTISNVKVDVLKLLTEGATSIRDLSDRLNISWQIMNHHRRELRKKNLIDLDNMNINAAGHWALI